MALVVTALFERVINTNAIVEDEALAVPHRLGLRHLCQIVQNTALEVIDLVKTQLA